MFGLDPTKHFDVPDDVILIYFYLYIYNCLNYKD